MNKMQPHTKRNPAFNKHGQLQDGVIYIINHESVYAKEELDGAIEELINILRQENPEINEDEFCETAVATVELRWICFLRKDQLMAAIAAVKERLNG